MTDANDIHWRPDIQGWSHDILPWYADQADRLPDGARVAEIGVHHGRSLLFLADRLWNQGKFRCYLLGVDSWSWGQQERVTFAANRESIGLAKSLVHAIGVTSTMAAEYADPESYDLVFLDGDHLYQSVAADIRAWWPKVKPGGILGGHDYGGAGTGVKQAVDEFSPVTVRETVWWVQK